MTKHINILIVKSISKLTNGDIGKILLLLCFLVYTNLEAKFLYRIDLLVHNFNGYTGAIIYILLWILSITSIILVAFTNNFKLRFFYSALIIISTSIGFTYELVSGTQINYDNLSIIWEARNLANDAFIFYKFKIFTAIVIIFIGLIALIQPTRLTKLNTRHASVQSGLIISPFILIFIISLIRAGGGTDGLPVQYKSLSLWIHIVSSRALQPDYTRDQIPLPINPKYEINNVIFIMDESVRGDYLDINKMRGITPSLMNNQNPIINFGLATSATNCSAGSNYLLRKGANYKNIRESMEKNPFIWEYAKSAGYKTHYIDAQASKDQLNNRMTLEEKSLIDNFVYPNASTRYFKDLRAVDYINDIIKMDNKNFIFLVKSGVHFPYEISYNLQTAKYHPHMLGSHLVNNRTLIKNSYKNAIEYSIDGFFNYLFKDIDLDNSIIIYTSDHGQNLLNNDSQLTHCSTNKTSHFEGIVPLLMTTNHNEIRSALTKNSSINYNNLNHFNIVPTILEIFGYDKKHTTKNHGTSIFDRVNERPGFISGVVSEYRLTLGKFSQIKFNTIPESIFYTKSPKIETNKELNK